MFDLPTLAYISAMLGLVIMITADRLSGTIRRKVWLTGLIVSLTSIIIFGILVR